MERYEKLLSNKVQLAAFISITIYVIHLLFAIYVERALFYDGANFFVLLLHKKFTWPLANDEQVMRNFANIFNQLPTSLAIKLGITNLKILKALFGASLFLGPCYFYVRSYLNCKKSKNSFLFLMSLSSLVLCSMPSEVFILNQSLIAVAMYWTLFSYVTVKEKLSFFSLCEIFIISTILFCAHEGSTGWGVLLFIFSIVHIIKNKTTNSSTHGLIIGFIGLSQSIFAFYWQIAHPHISQRTTFIKSLLLFYPGELWDGNTRITLVIFISIVLIILANKIIRKHTQHIFLKLIFIITSSTLLYTVTAAYVDPSIIDPNREYMYRMLIVFGSGPLMLILIFASLWNLEISKVIINKLYIMIFLGLGSASLWQIRNSISWNDFQSNSLKVIEKSQEKIVSPTKVKQSLLLANSLYLYKYSYFWTWPVFSIAIQNRQNINKFFKPSPNLYPEYFTIPSNSKENLIVPFITFRNDGYFNFNKLFH